MQLGNASTKIFAPWQADPSVEALPFWIRTTNPGSWSVISVRIWTSAGELKTEAKPIATYETDDALAWLKFATPLPNRSGGDIRLRVDPSLAVPSSQPLEARVRSPIATLDISPGWHRGDPFVQGLNDCAPIARSDPNFWADLLTTIGLEWIAISREQGNLRRNDRVVLLERADLWATSEEKRLPILVLGKQASGAWPATIDAVVGEARSRGLLSFAVSSEQRSRTRLGGAFGVYFLDPGSGMWLDSSGRPSMVWNSNSRRILIVDLGQDIRVGESPTLIIMGEIAGLLPEPYRGAYSDFGATKWKS